MGGLRQLREWLVGPAGDAATLPLRVRQAIQRQQSASEIAIGWVQLSVVVVFATLYAIAPKTFTADAPFEPVPWVLGAYALFTLVRLGLAYLDRLANWFLILSVVADIALLMGTIWSFHLQYEQPASFYLKAPALLYVFIFIALRALRFEARFILLTGLFAAAGWLGLVFYATVIDPANDMITRDYVLYMTSNSVLLGAEFDKVVSILLVTAILAAAILRARRLLERAVAEGAAAHDLARFFSPDVARRITAAESEVVAGHGEARDAAILNIDIRGFTLLAAEMPPAALIGLLADYQSRLVPVIRRHGGSIDKFIGDGILATFGAARSGDRYAADALRAVDDVMAAVDAWNAERAAIGAAPVRVGAAVAAGRVVFGAVGDSDRLEYTVIGDPVNLSAKLEKHTKTEKVRALADRAAYEAATAQGYRPPETRAERKQRNIDGVDEPMDLMVLAA